jgi:hypothetical protein
MRISSNQWESLATVATSVLARRIIHLFQQHLPEGHVDVHQSSIDAVRQQINRARGYGLESEYEVSVYVVCAYLLGKDFDDRFSEARTLLNSETTGREKAHWLRCWTQTVFATLQE